MNKKCTKCHITKHSDFFYKCKDKKDGYQSHCKECHYKATKNWRNNNLKKYQNYEKNRHRTDAQKKRNQKYARKRRINMNNSYIRELICKKSKINPEYVTQELIDIWRLNLKKQHLL